MFLSAASPRVSLLLDPRSRCGLGGLGRKVRSACEEFEDSEVVFWVNVSECSIAGLPGLSC